MCQQRNTQSTRKTSVWRNIRIQCFWRDVRRWWVPSSRRKSTNTRLMTLSRSACFVTWEGTFQTDHCWNTQVQYHQVCSIHYSIQYIKCIFCLDFELSANWFLSTLTTLLNVPLILSRVVTITNFKQLSSSSSSQRNGSMKLIPAFQGRNSLKVSNCSSISQKGGS